MSSTQPTETACLRLQVPYFVQLVGGFHSGTVQLKRNSFLGSRNTQQRTIRSQLQRELQADLTKSCIKARTSSSGSKADIESFKTTSIDNFVQDSGEIVLGVATQLIINNSTWEQRFGQLSERLEHLPERLKQQSERPKQQSERHEQQSSAIQQLQAEVGVLPVDAENFSTILWCSLVEEAHRKLGALPDGVSPRRDNETWSEYIARIQFECGPGWASSKGLSQSSLFLLPKGVGTTFHEGSRAAHRL
ncbi:hypothetical protein Vafri_12376 [Volvox africanus]|uniref:Uncharacterized protein n=1 Tax=Volvox africanus TaxID=51714 RepID=A0A8J4F4D0_9CHLO|nr:hypothetical protein Vafri_12376 [Volvox africanus]